VKARYVGVCRGCGAYTQPRNGKGDAYAYCHACHPGAIERRWSRERVLEAMPGMARALRPMAIVLRLVADPRPSARRGRAAAPGRRPLAVGQLGQRGVRNLGCRASGSCGDAATASASDGRRHTRVADRLASRGGVTPRGPWVQCALATGPPGANAVPTGRGCRRVNRNRIQMPGARWLGNECSRAALGRTQPPR